MINQFTDKIIPDYDLILDNPWETDEDLIETLMFLARFPAPYKLNCYSLTFYPETELYWKAKRDGIVTDDLEDIYRKYYLTCKKTYLNRLFFLLNEYTSGGWKISTKIMSALTSQKLRQLKLNWLLYIMLKIGAIPLRAQRLKLLLHEGSKDMRKGDWFRIIRFISYIKEHLQNFDLKM